MEAHELRHANAQGNDARGYSTRTVATPTTVPSSCKPGLQVEHFHAKLELFFHLSNYLLPVFSENLLCFETQQGNVPLHRFLLNN